MMINSIQTHDASALTGGEILKTLKPNEQFHYISGAIGGIAYARFVRDRPSETGMKCMLNWWYKSNSTVAWDTIKQWLEHHKDKTAEIVLYALLSKECGQ